MPSVRHRRSMWRMDGWMPRPNGGRGHRQQAWPRSRMPRRPLRLICMRSRPVLEGGRVDASRELGGGHRGSVRALEAYERRPRRRTNPPIRMEHSWRILRWRLRKSRQPSSQSRQWQCFHRLFCDALLRSEELKRIDAQNMRENEE